MNVFAAVAARASATSPSGSRRHCSANGAIATGSAMRCPSTLDSSERALVSTSTRGRKCQRAKASVLSRIVRSSPAPPATYTYAPGARRSFANAWSSATVRIRARSTGSRTTVTGEPDSARLHPVQEVDEIFARRPEDIEVVDLLGAGRLDVVRLARG